MTVAARRRKHGNKAVFKHELFQPFAAARDNKVNGFFAGQKFFRAVVGRVVDKLHDIFVIARLFDGFRHNLINRAIAVQRLSASAKYRRVAAFYAKYGGVDGNVGTGFVNNRDHAQWRAHFFDMQSAGSVPLCGDFADGIFKVDDCPYSLNHLHHTLFVQQKSVEKRGRFVGENIKVLFVFRNNEIFICRNAFGNCRKHLVFVVG